MLELTHPLNQQLPCEVVFSMSPDPSFKDELVRIFWISLAEDSQEFLDLSQE
jgi:hypothetical protein